MRGGIVIGHHVQRVDDAIVVDVAFQDFQALSESGAAAQREARGIRQSVGSSPRQGGREVTDSELVEGPGQRIGSQAAEARGCDAAEAVYVAMSDGFRKDHPDAVDRPRQAVSRCADYVVALRSPEHLKGGDRGPRARRHRGSKESRRSGRAEILGSALKGSGQSG